MKSDETGTLSEHVQLVRLPDLQAWTRNPHKHPESQLSTLASNIRTFGFTSLPVLAFYPGETRGFVSSGNGRLESLHLLRAQYPQNPPPGIDTDTDGEWLIPVRPMQFPSRLIAEAQGLSDNWIASMPGVEDDTERLTEILLDLQEQEIDFSGLGKDMDDLANLLADVPSDDDWSAAMSGLPDADRAPIQQMTFTLHDDQAASVKRAIEAAKAMGDFVDTGNENSNGNALARVAEIFLSRLS